MAEVKEPRKGTRYRSPLREQQAQNTRQTVLRAAHDLFLTQGYEATTIEQVAARAGVSKPTVFTAVGNKGMLLAAVREIAMAGDDQPLAVADRPDAQRAFNATTPEEVIEGFASLSSGISRRYARIDHVLRRAAASEPELRQLWETSEREREVGAGLCIDAVLRVGCLRASLTRATAIDMVWLLIAPDQYFRLVYERGWAPSAHRDWLAETLKAVLLEDRTAPTGIS